MKNLVWLLALSGLLTACATTNLPRTKWTDKNMRVMIDPDSVDEENYIQIQSALVRSGNFTVVDRARGLTAVKKEQERLHVEEPDRYADREKWAHWGKLYGVGTIIVGHTQCSKEFSYFNRTKMYLNCKQFLSMVDSNTGEVFLAVEGRNEGQATYDLSYIVPDWNETVQKMVDEYPKNFRNENYASTVTQYQDLSAEHAQRMKERKPAKVEVKEQTEQEVQ